MREACKFNVQIHNGNILMSSVTKDPGVSSILLFSGSGIIFPRPLYICFHEFLLHHLYTGGRTKKTGNLNLAFEKADSTSSTPLTRKGSRLAKKSVYLPPIFQNCVYELG
jgi:hypothetical protein